MKKSLISMAALLAALVACNKEPQQVTPDDVDGKVYMQFSVNMLTTRSGTDDPNNNYGSSDATPGVEVGKDIENVISKVDVVLRDANGVHYIANDVTPNPAADDTYIASFNTTSITSGQTYSVYIYANCDATNASTLDEISSVGIDAMTKPNNFWMTNAYAANTVDIPADLAPYTVKNNPLNLGEHFVERAMARFDFMPRGDNPDTAPNVYALGKNSENQTTVNIELTHMALINHSKDFYMLRRTSADGTNTNWAIGGVETKQNYVVDTDYALKANGYVAANAEKIVAQFEDHMNNPTEWDFTAISDVVKPENEDNWNGSDDGVTGALPEPNHGLNEYYVWRYAKENTIPGKDAQDNGITTGVVFKGKIAATEAAPESLKTAMTSGKRIYVFENELLGTWADVKAAATATNAKATLAYAYSQAIAGMTEDAIDPVAATAATAGFTGYSAVNEGTTDAPSYAYYAYYYYWNRHNDNGNNAEMGIMEFAVVRNNVYKLCVDKIAKFGHPDPSDPGNPDPDKPDPEDPDESLDYYFTVTVKVLPWVVRVNHIEF